MPPSTPSRRLARALVALASLLVPRHRRRAWREEWEAEIWHYRGPGVVLRCLGAFPHALSILIHHGRFDMIGHDLRYALRRLLRSPGFSSVAVATLALGIGANVAIFSVVDAVVLAPLPYEEPEELVALWEWNVPRDDRQNVVNPGNFNAWREQSRSFRGMAAVFPNRLVVTGAGAPAEVDAGITTGNFFRVLGLEPALGRSYTLGDLEEGDRPVVVSHRFWQERLGGDPAALGRTLTFNGQTGVVVGILPPVFVAPAPEADVFSPMDISSITPDQTGRSGRVVARLADGVGLGAARREMRALAERLQEDYPAVNSGWSVSVIPLREDTVGAFRPALTVLLGSVGLLLLVACGNVANLLLARGAGRRREMAVRTSLGAGPGRLARQLLTESGVLAFLGAAGGVALAHLGTRYGTRALGRSFPLPRITEASVDGRVLLFAVGAAVVTGLVFGLAPVFQTRGLEPGQALADGGRRGHAGGAGGRTRGALVVAEVALSLVLLVGAGLLLRSFGELVSVDPGIEPRGVLTARVNLAGPAYGDPQARVRFHQELQRRLRALPGVRAVGMNVFLPLDGPGSATDYYPLDRPEPPPGEKPVALIRMVQGDYFRAMGISLLQGRALRGADRAEDRKVAVVNRSLAREAWPDENPVGKRLAYNWGAWEEVEVVGVVEDVRARGLQGPGGPGVYVPYAQNAVFRFAGLAVRTSGDPGSLARGLEEAVAELDPGVPVTEVRSMDQVVSASVARPRLTAVLMGTFAALAVVLAGVGLYGVLSYTVSRRVGEVGIRMALGARARDVLGLVVRQGMTLALAGAVLGLAGAWAAARLVESLLFQVAPTDPATFAGVTGFVLLVAVAACAIPAWRAARVDPAEALRSE